MTIDSTASFAVALTVGAAALALITLARRRRASHLRSIVPQPSALRVGTGAVGLTTATVVLFGLAAAALRRRPLAVPGWRRSGGGRGAQGRA